MRLIGHLWQVLDVHVHNARHIVAEALHRGLGPFLLRYQVVEGQLQVPAQRYHDDHWGGRGWWVWGRWERSVNSLR